MIILLVLAMIACGMVDPRKHTTTDPEFAPYVEIFARETGQDVSAYPINFELIDEGHAGEAWRHAGWCEIAIDRDWWDDNPEPLREILIGHELGHCTGREHMDLVYTNGEPISIMYWSVGYYDPDYFMSQRDVYYAEMRDYYADQRRMRLRETRRSE